MGQSGSPFFVAQQFRNFCSSKAIKDAACKGSQYLSKSASNFSTSPFFLNGPPRVGVRGCHLIVTKKKGPAEREASVSLYLRREFLLPGWKMRGRGDGERQRDRESS